MNKHSIEQTIRSIINEIPYLPNISKEEQSPYLYQQCAQLSIELLGKDHPLYLEALILAGSTYGLLGFHSQGLELAAEAFSKFPQEHPSYAIHAYLVGTLYDGCNLLQPAHDCYQLAESFGKAGSKSRNLAMIAQMSIAKEIQGAELQQPSDEAENSNLPCPGRVH